MRKVFFVLVLAACAARQQPRAAAPPGWNPEQIAEVRGRCFARWTDHGAGPRGAKAMCSCMVPQFIQQFTYQWLDDGHAITPEEVETIGDIQDRCARQVADSGVLQSASEQEGTGSTDR